MAHRKDLTGQTFGLLTVIGYDKTVKGRSMWLCKCKCGKTKSVYRYSLIAGHTQSCGCCWKTGRRPKYVPKGTRFGKLTVIKSLGVRPITYADGCFATRQFLLCECDCGTLKEVSLCSLTAGVKSCGCEKRGRKPHRDKAQ